MQMSSLKKSTDAKTTCIYAHKIHYCLWKKSQAESNMQSASLATKREKRLDSVKAWTKRDKLFPLLLSNRKKTTETVSSQQTNSLPLLLSNHF